MAEGACDGAPAPASSNGSLCGFESLEQLLQARLPPEELAQVQRLLYGWNAGRPVQALPLPLAAAAAAEAAKFDLQAYRFEAAPEQLRPPRLVRIGLIQHGIVAPTTAPFAEQRQAIFDRVRTLVDAAVAAGVQVLCLQEFWACPYFFCTRERGWCEFAESAEEGPSTRLCQELARRHNMVIVSPILERDEAHGGTIWNTAVVVGNNGNVIGKHRKNHVTRCGGFNESMYYMESDTGHPVFETSFGKIAVNICYGRHIPLNCLTFALNGAEVVFNPCCTLGGWAFESLWPIEARYAAAANSYYMCAINRVGTEAFPNAFTSGDGGPAHKELGPYFGSSYVAAPDGSRCPSLSRDRDGLLVAELDLNLCRQAEDRFNFRMCGRHDMYAELLARYVRPDFRPQVVRDPSLPAAPGSTA
ncbi:hypothetical protein ABPG75_010809 [Micractinium tetrahymenae]